MNKNEREASRPLIKGRDAHNIDLEFYSWKIDCSQRVIIDELFKFLDYSINIKI